MCRVRALLVAVLIASALVPVPVGATDRHAPAPGAAQLGDAGIEPDGVLLRADLRADGDARWTVEYRVRLNDENTTAAFESLRDDIEADETAYTSTFADRMGATVRAAENATGREMAVRNVSVRATRRQLPQEYGVVTYRFEWTGFAVADGDTLDAGDALAGLFLDRQTTFVVAWPDGYATTDVQPAPDERREDAVVWVGPRDFGDGEPSISVSTTAAGTAGDGSGGASDGGDGGDGGSDGAGGPDGTGDGSSLLPLAVGALVVVGGVVGALLWRRSQQTSTAPVGGGDAAAERIGDEDGGAATAGPAEGDAAAGTSVDEPGDEADEAPDDSDEADEAPDDSDDAGSVGEEAAPWEDELLSNEERVVVLLEHNDGRMKQQAVASELGWSDAKTSQVIGKLRDAEEIETFRLGRENVVSLPGSGLS